MSFEVKGCSRIYSSPGVAHSSYTQRDGRLRDAGTGDDDFFVVMLLEEALFTAGVHFVLVSGALVLMFLMLSVVVYG